MAARCLVATRLPGGRVPSRVETGPGDVAAAALAVLPTEQRALPLPELADLDAVYGYSFVVTNLGPDPAHPGMAVRLVVDLADLLRQLGVGALAPARPGGPPPVAAVLG